MKLVNLNIGYNQENIDTLLDYLANQNADLFTFQEVYYPIDSGVKEKYNSKKKLDTVLKSTYPNTFYGDLWEASGDRYLERENSDDIDYGGYIRQCNYIMSKYPIDDGKNIFYHKTFERYHYADFFFKEDHGRALQIAYLSTPQGILCLANIHGIWTKDKKDCEFTPKQTECIINMLSEIQYPMILAGDFNLQPNSLAIQELSKNFHNLIDIHQIKRTRPSFRNPIEGGDTIVDYIFVNDKVKVSSMFVNEITISDHYPLVLDFSI